MKLYFRILLYTLVVCIKLTDPYPPSVVSVVTVEDDVILGNTLPRYGTVCAKTPVRGGPDDSIYKIEYFLLPGDTVRLREQGGEGRSWVMIKAAYWIRLSDICEWSNNE